MFAIILVIALIASMAVPALVALLIIKLDARSRRINHGPSSSSFRAWMG